MALGCEEVLLSGGCALFMPLMHWVFGVEHGQDPARHIVTSRTPKKVPDVLLESPLGGFLPLEQGPKALPSPCITERSKHKARRTSRSSSTSSSSSSSSSSASSSSSSDGRKKRAKHKEKRRKKKKKKRKKKLKKRGKEKAVVVHQAEALPGPSLDQWHRSAGGDNDGPGIMAG